MRRRVEVAVTSTHREYSVFFHRESHLSSTSNFPSVFDSGGALDVGVTIASAGCYALIRGAGSLV